MADPDTSSIEQEGQWRCLSCTSGHCERCTDIVMIVMDREPICECTAEGHSGEPSGRQILDPITGDVYTPGLRVTNEGKVEYLVRDSSE